MFGITKEKLVLTANRFGLQLQKHSPEICLGLGIVTVIGGMVAVYTATLKVDEVIEKADADIEKIKKTAVEMPEKYTEEDMNQDLTIVHVQKIVNVAKLYLPAAALGLAGIGLILISHNIMANRNAALVSAFTILNASFANYRKRVIEEYGEEKDYSFRTGTKQIEVEKVTEVNGEEVKSKELINVETMLPELYRFSFDENSNQWKRNYEYNMVFLQQAQRQMNDELNRNGHVFLNEVLDLLDIPRVDYGQLVGWIKSDTYPQHYEEKSLTEWVKTGKTPFVEHYGDDYIDFDIDNPKNQEGPNTNNVGWSRSFVLEFNVDGIIFNMI